MASYPTRSRRRSPGEGSIYAYRGRCRGALTWTDRDGIRRRSTVCGKTQAEVRRRLDALRVELDRGLAPAAPSTVADFLAGWSESSQQRIRPSTWRQYEGAVRVSLTPALGWITLAKLTPTGQARRRTRTVTFGSGPVQGRSLRPR